MTRLFITHTRNDEACAQAIRHDLEARGYEVLTSAQLDPSNPDLTVREVERGVRISSAVIVVWSADAKQSEWVERYYTLAERLKKDLVFVTIDKTEPPVVSAGAKFVKSGPSCVDATSQMLPHLPAPGADEQLSEVLIRLADERVRERRAGIEQAANLLNEQGHRSRLMPLLEDIARNDEIINLRDSARKQVEFVEKSQTSPPHEAKSPHIVEVICPRDTTHLNRLDKRELCIKHRKAYRRVAGAELDTINVTCQYCDVVMEFKLDCEGYR